MNISKKQYNEILAKEYSNEFDEHRKKAMVVGHFKYGSIFANRAVNAVDLIKSIRMRLDAYDKTGNTEFMCDVANFAMIEYMCPGHPKAHFEATDSDRSPGVSGMSVGEMERFKEDTEEWRK